MTEPVISHGRSTTNPHRHFPTNSVAFPLGHFRALERENPENVVIERAGGCRCLGVLLFDFNVDWIDDMRDVLILPRFDFQQRPTQPQHRHFLGLSSPPSYPDPFLQWRCLAVWRVFAPA